MPGNKTDKGSVLVLTLLSLCMLSVFSVQLGYGVRQKLTLAVRLDRKEKLRLAAEAGILKGIADIETAEDIISVGRGSVEIREKDVFAEDTTEDGDEKEKQGYGSSYTVAGEEGKINVNRVDVKVLTRLFQIVTDMDERAAPDLAYCIIDWRDKDPHYKHPRYGAEDDYYRRLRCPYGAKDAEFEVLDELMLVKGMNPGIFDKVKGYLTVYGEGKININSTSKEVLLALGVRDVLAEKILLFRSGADSTLGTVDDRQFSKPSSIVPELSQSADLSPGEVSVLSNLVSKGTFITESEYFMITSTGKLYRRDAEYRIACVVENDGTIVYWHEE